MNEGPQDKREVAREAELPDLRIAAVWALEDMDDEDAAVALLADVAKNDPSRKVRRVAIQVLGEIDTDEAHQALLDILKERYPCESLPYGAQTSIARELGCSRELVRQVANRHGFSGRVIPPRYQRQTCE